MGKKTEDKSSERQINRKNSAILCPTKTEVADFVSFKGSIVQGLILLDKLESDKLSLLLQFLVDGLNTAPYQINGNNH